MIRRIDRYIVDLIIIFELLVILTTILYSIKTAMYFLGAVIVLSYLLGVSLFFYTKLNIFSDKKTLFFYLLSIVSSLLYSFYLRDDMKNTLIFISGIMLLYYFYKRGLDKVNIYLLLLSCCIIILVIMINSTAPSNYDKKYYFRSVWENANMAGIAVMSALFPVVIGIFYVKKKFIKLFLFLLSILGVYLLILTFNRGSLFSLIAFIMLLILNRKYYKLKNIIRILFLLAPIIILVLFINYIVFYGDIQILGKSIAQRPGWPLLFASILENPFITYKLPSGGLNLFIAGTIEFGVLGIIAYTLLLINMNPKWELYSKIQYWHIAYFAFLVIFIQQSFENTISDGAFGLYVYSYLLLGFANSNNGC